MIGDQICSETEDDALSYKDNSTDIKHDFVEQFQILTEVSYNILKEKELGKCCFYLVAKPLDKGYTTKGHDWYRTKGLSKVMSKLSSLGVKDHYVGSTEALASKVHHNIIFYSRDIAKISAEHDKIWFHTWKIYVKPVIDLRKCIDYIFKEALHRVFFLYMDYSFKEYHLIKKTAHQVMCLNNGTRKAKKGDDENPFLINIV